MTAPSEMLYRSDLGPDERVGRGFLFALALHALVIGGGFMLNAHRESFGAKDAGGGTVSIETVNAIPLPSHGPENHLATDTESEVPMTPPKPTARAKAEKPPPDAVPIKSRTPKKAVADAASEPSHLRLSRKTIRISDQQGRSGAVHPDIFGGWRRTHLAGVAHTLGENFAFTANKSRTWWLRIGRPIRWTEMLRTRPR